LAWRRGLCTGRTAAISAALLVAVVAQAIAGGSGLLALHIPLGVAVFGGYAALLAALWRR
jgi:hypothetical protein